MASPVPGVIVAGLLLLPGAGYAQKAADGASVPGVRVTRDAPPRDVATPRAERPRETQVPPPAQRRDQFLATPDTYSPSPRYDRMPRRFHQQRFPNVYGSYGSYGSYGYVSDFYAPAPPMTTTLPEERMLPSVPDGFLRLVVEPLTAQVYVDGYFVGTVAEFNGALDAGSHRVELREPGFETAAFALRLAPDEMVTYRTRLRSIGNAAAVAIPVAPPGSPRTIYVIPRCYAGDTPPRAAQLPAGCDVTNLRRVPAS